MSTATFAHGWPYWPRVVCPHCGQKNDPRANVRDDDEMCCTACYRKFPLAERVNEN